MRKLEVIEQEKLAEIHDASIKILQETGIQVHHDGALELFKQHGASVDQQVVRLSRKMIEDCMAQVPSQFTWKARN